MTGSSGHRSSPSASQPLSVARSKILSKLRRTSPKSRRLSFHRVLNSLFRSSNGNSATSRPSVANSIHMNSESLRPVAELNQSMSVDILFPPAFTFSGPMLQPSSTSPSTSSTSRASTTHLGSQTDHMRWSFITGGSSLFASPDGSNDESSLGNGNGSVFEPTLGPLFRTLPETAPSSQGILSALRLTQSIEPSLRVFSDSVEIQRTYEGAPETPPLPESYIPSPTKAPWLPLELLHDIFLYLRPVDFNSARHVCRRWMLASLDFRILHKMLRRAGWSSFARGGIMGENDSTLGDKDSKLRVSDALSRVCGLGPDWTGPGVPLSWEGALPTITSASRKSILVESCDVDFTELASGSQENNRSGFSGLLFTVSACGRFLMVVDGSMIYVYQLGPGDLELAIRIACPRRVIGVSMDTTCGRYAVAAFLDGRVGMVCDFQLNRSIAPSLSEETYDYLSRHSTHCPILHDRDNSDESIHSNDSRSSSPLALISAEDSSPRKRTISVAANEIPLTENQEIRQGMRRRQSHTDSQQGSSKHTHRFSTHSVCPTLAPDKRTVYHDLCYPDDPPRTVAICPSRSCVAFGCSAGIQLHWIDVVTKRQEDRFFPLSATTDVLYFLPPRAGIDVLPSGTSRVTDLQSGPETRRLRLIGSAVAPCFSIFPPRTELSRRMFGAKDLSQRGQAKEQTCGKAPFVSQIATVETEKLSRRGSSHERLQQDWSLAELEGSVKQTIHGEPSPLRQYRQSDHDNSLTDLWRKWALGSRHDKKPPKPNFDHYRAVPLSDGHHILFTDPSTGLLCLGCDAPSERPMKLTRKLVLEPPFWQGRAASTEQLRQRNVDSKIGKDKARGKRTSSLDPLRHSEDDGSTSQNPRDNDVLLLPTIYAAGTNLEHGVFVVAGYEEDLVLFTIPPDVFAVSQQELQLAKDNRHDTGHDHENIQGWLEYWPDSVSWSIAASFAGVRDADPGSAPDDPGFLNSPPLTGPANPGIWPLKIRGTWLGKVPTLVDVAVCNEDGELVVWAFGADGHAHVLEIDSVRVRSDGHIPLKRRLATRAGGIEGRLRHTESSDFDLGAP